MVDRRLCVALCAAAVCLGAIAGCGRRVTVVRANPTEVDRSEYASMFRAAQEVLREEGFVLDRSDYRFGVITTLGLSSPTVLEPWHGSNTTLEQALASTTNHRRRLARVTLEPVEPAPAAPASRTLVERISDAPAGDAPETAPAAPPPEPETYLLRVEVAVEQRQNPARRLNGSTSGGRVYNVLNEVPSELRERGITGPYWQTVGRDPYLEQRLLAQILRRSVRIR